MKSDFIDGLEISKKQKICIINMPIPYRGELANLPQDTIVSSRPIGKFDSVIFFTNTLEDLSSSVERITAATGAKGKLWIVIPTTASNVYRDLDSQIVQQNSGMEIAREVNIFEDWVALEMKINL